MNKTYLFTDPHYGHKNICRGTSEWNPCRTIRDFETIEKMNNAIVESINAIADQNDTLMCLGDWSFGGIENVYTFYCRLICKNIIFIPGNHDKHIIMDKYLNYLYKKAEVNLGFLRYNINYPNSINPL